MKTSRLFFSLLYILILFLQPDSLFSQSGWVQQNTGTTGNLDYVEFVDANTGFTGRPLLKTTNGGSNWIPLSGVSNAYSIEMINPNTGYALTNDIFKTIDGGSNWTIVSPEVNPWDYASFINEQTGYVGGTKEFTSLVMWGTTNGGTNWQSHIAYTGTWPCILRFNDIKALTLNTIYSTVFYYDDANMIRIRSVIKSSNGGASFVTLFQNDTVEFGKFAFPSNDTGYVTANGTPYTNKSYVIKSVFDNWSYTNAISVFTDVEIYDIEFPSMNTGYVAGMRVDGTYWRGAIYKTTNGGLNWYLLDLNISSNDIFTSLNFINDQTGWAVGENGLIIKTTTGGESPVLNSVSGTVKYQDNNQPVISGYVKALRFDSLSHNIITVDSAQIQPNGTYTLPHCPPVILDIMAYENDEEELSFVPTYYVSTINWQNSTHVKPDSNLVNIDIAVKRIVNPGDSMHISGYVYTNNSSDYNSLKDAVIYARASGTFKSHSISLSNGYYKVDSLSSGVYELIVDRMGYEDDSFILSLTNSSLNNINFYLQDAIVPVNIISSEIPGSFMLEQNYPNPFNPVTSIQFSIASPTFAKLVIYDILGREVKVLLAEQLSAGTYKSVWNASNYPSGVYFYRLETDDFTASKKMLLLK